MNPECLRIADQLRRAFGGDAWHGSPLRDLLADVTPARARSRPLQSAHSIWELVLHIDTWVEAALGATQLTPMPKIVGTEQDWPVPAADDAAWTATTNHLFQNSDRLAQAITNFDDARLSATVPGRAYDFYHLFHGIVQHSLYHGGQIALLKKATAVP